MIKTLAAFSPIVIFAAAIGYNATGAQTCTIAPDFTFSGKLVDVETCRGRLGWNTFEPRIVHRY